MSRSSHAFVPAAPWSSESAHDAAPTIDAFSHRGPTVFAHVHPTDELPPWFPGLIARLNELVALEDGWAGPGSTAPTPEVGLRALSVLNELVQPGLVEPQILPTVDGGLQFEWHVRGVDLEITVLPWGETDVYSSGGAARGEWAGDLAQHLEDLRLVLKDLSG